MTHTTARHRPGAAGGDLPDAAVTSNGLVLTWPDGRQQPLDRFWLRDNCRCPACLHPHTLERSYDVMAAPDDLAPAGAQISATAGREPLLRVQWNHDPHETVHPLLWLAQFAADAPVDTAATTVRTWDTASFGGPTRVDHGDYMTSDSACARWLRHLVSDGIVLLDRGPTAKGEVLRVARRIGPPRRTNFGLVFDVVSKKKPNNSAYTAMGLAAHVDLPNWERPPDYQLLYCLVNQAEGGQSFFVDGFRVAETLRQESPDDFQILASTPIDFRFQDSGQDIAYRAPMIGCDNDGRLQEIRYNQWILDAVRLPAGEMAAFYAAYRRFGRMLRDPRFVVGLRLEPGQMVTFDNRRILHGRGAFDPTTGARHLQGTYLDRDVVTSRLKVLSRR